MVPQSRILIVDDVVDNIRVAMNILKEHNFDFSFATNGADALRLVNEHPENFDLILLDVMMPQLDGFEVCKQLKTNPRTMDVPIIFLTAKVDIDSVTKGFALGGLDYITKPFHAAELLARVKTHVDLHQAKVLLKYNNIALEVKARFEQKRLLSELEESQKEIICVLTELMEATSDETGKHIRRVSESAALLARYHEALTDEDAHILYHAAPMHDIGKLTIPAEILHKPGRYDDAEFEIMKQHTSNAFGLLNWSDRRLLKAAAIIAHEHHEKWDGTGYPRGLRGTEIHIYGRIVALADVFDALSHSRRYKTAWSISEVVEYIKNLREKQFDPYLVDIFIQHIDDFIDIAKIT
ncbi:response regulator [Methylocucumis oryzae]|uniref:Response regulator receiver protein n=1 Tax=Methylocucumis oryzae TaxID=1632867 RepID=A0A0F3IMF0_9GAMM|nr:HD domain-containing phosphohydrolase [Methylocucumis oryzae]KJV07703.1 response regulator receiver protein [Methylocucumis oryzae]